MPAADELGAGKADVSDKADSQDGPAILYAALHTALYPGDKG
jgi:hypothetical protein